MNMFDDLVAIDDIFKKDEVLWKLLYHPSKHFEDDPLSKENILEYPPEKLFPIMNLRLKHTPVTDDLAENKICRVIFYPEIRRPQRNYKVANQNVNVDVWVHRDFNDTDMRLSKICDRVNYLFSNKHITGMGKVEFVTGDVLMMADKGYIGYSMTYSFGSGNA